MGKTYSNRSENKGNRKNVKFFRVCGLCGEKYQQSAMIRNKKSSTGWVCRDCFEDENSDYFNGFEDRFY